MPLQEKIPLQDTHSTLEAIQNEGETPLIFGELEHYIESCQAPEDGSSKKKKGKFPNLAGFCRRLGQGISWFDGLQHSHPLLYERICAVLEDEALNAELSPTVLAAYLKKRLGYGDKPEVTSETDCGQIRLVFEHDIVEDGI